MGGNATPPTIEAAMTWAPACRAPGSPWSAPGRPSQAAVLVERPDDPALSAATWKLSIHRS